MFWLIGNKGCLGSAIEKEFKKIPIDYFASDQELDITNINSVRRILKELSPEWVVNCSAYTLVDKAEADSLQAYAVNAYGVDNLAVVAAESKKTKILHFSTDYVFDGKKGSAYKEADRPAPLSVYGESKLLGENLLRKRLKNRYVIIRTSWLYGLQGNNFVKKIISSLGKDQELRVVNDQWGAPTYANDLALAAVNLVKKNPTYGVYHFTNRGKATWYDFALEIYDRLAQAGRIKKGVVIKPIPSSELKSPATRPRFSLLSSEKIKKILDIDIRTWQEALEEYLENINI
jgi:dTDP-4-dehydrorhamnose reductase